jgi:DNA polymerase-1
VVALEHRALPAVAWIELVGVPFDRDVWNKAALEAEKDRDRKLQALPVLGVKNWNSSEQVLAYLRDHLGLKVANTREETLAAFKGNDVVDALLEYREAAKLTQNYGVQWANQWANKWAHGDRLYPSWKQIGAETGRMACAQPNMQQVPRRSAYRSAFRPGAGRVLIKADYSQIELRLAAAIAKDRRMLDAFARGEDLHRLTASLVLGKAPGDVSKADRQLAKALNFGLLYGLGAEGLRKYAQTGYGVQLTLEAAQKFRAAFFDAYSGLRAWHRRTPEGETEVRTVLGRRRVTNRFTEKLNTPVQGSGADGLKSALALLWEGRLKAPSRCAPVLVVHDEIVVEAPEGSALEAKAWLEDSMRRGMEAVLKDVPVEVEGGVYRDWGVTPC